MEVVTGLPIIASDIDGVLLHRREQIEGVKDCLEFLQQQKENIPFLLMTNRGGFPESQMVDDFNGIYDLKEQYKIQYDQMIMHHTPMRPLFEKYKNEMILLISRDTTPELQFKLHSLMQYIGQTQYITGDEYCNMYPQLVPLSKRTKEGQQKSLSEVSERTGRSISELQEKPVRISAIFTFLVPLDWEDNMQIILDILSTENGEVADKINKGNKQHVPIFVGFNDIGFKTKQIALPRMIMGCFSESLKQLYRKLYDSELEITQYGKPMPVAYNYLETLSNTKLGEENSKLFRNKYFIGDNPKTDIKGANDAGWISIMVRTGVFSHGDNDIENPAKFVVYDFKEAIQLICKLEQISLPPNLSNSQEQQL